MNADERPRYLDRCNECGPRHVIVSPFQVRRSDNGVGETAAYLCPTGHTWHTGWNYNSERRAA